MTGLICHSEHSEESKNHYSCEDFKTTAARNLIDLTKMNISFGALPSGWQTGLFCLLLAINGHYC
jgi:hypothetical protein